MAFVFPEKIRFLDRHDPGDVEFARETFGFEAEEQGWFRERDRLFVFRGVLSAAQARRRLEGPPPPSVLDSLPPLLGNGPASRPFLVMEDGTKVTWVRRPEALLKGARPHWRGHRAVFEVEGKAPAYTAYTAISGFAPLDGGDGNFRVLAPGGIRWVDYPSRAAACADALDMSLAVAMKIQVVRTPSAGNKIAVFGDKREKGAILRSLFSAYERMGFIATSADLGLSIEDLREHALPVAPTTLVPLGVYQGGLPSAQVTADAVFSGLEAMTEALPGSPALATLTVSMQGLGEVGFDVARRLLAAGARVLAAEVNPETIERFRADEHVAHECGRAAVISNPEAVYDTPADIFCPCARRGILHKRTLRRLLRAGVRIIGGPANNVFLDQAEDPWAFHEACLPVVPYEAIGAGGVTGVAHSVMTGVFGRAPFGAAEKVAMIRAFVAKVLAWAARHDLPPQVISDRILFRSAQRRAVLSESRTDEILDALRWAFRQPDRERENAVVNEYTKRGLFYGPGRHAEGGWKFLRG